MSAPIDLSILIVNWNRTDLTRACLDSLRRYIFSALALETILIDNGSSEDNLQRIRTIVHEMQVYLIENLENLGFARANNQGLCLARGRYVLLLNNDTVVPENSLINMVTYMDGHPEVGIVGAYLLNPDGSPQRCFGEFPLSPRQMVFRRILHLFQNPSHQLDARALPSFSHGAIEVDWVLGAALMARRSIVEQIGLLDERFFMYAEDLDWCYRAKHAGWKIVCLSTAPIYHHDGGSSKGMPEIESRLLAQREKSLEMFYHKQYGRFAAVFLHMVHTRKRVFQTFKNL